MSNDLENRVHCHCPGCTEMRSWIWDRLEGATTKGVLIDSFLPENAIPKEMMDYWHYIVIVYLVEIAIKRMEQTMIDAGHEQFIQEFLSRKMDFSRKRTEKRAEDARGGIPKKFRGEG